VGIARAKDIIFSGRFVPAEEAEAIGLVDAVVPPEDVYDKAMERATSYASGPTVALMAAKQAIQNGVEVDLASGLILERQAFAALFATQDQKSGMESFVESGPGKARFVGR
jgi:enoyl-CoA hydratase/carnithine racemase